MIDPNPTRREFLRGILPGSTLACLSCTNLCGLFRSAYAQDQQSLQHKFLADSNMSYAEVFDFAFAHYFIPTLQSLQAQTGEQEFLDSLKRASAESGRSVGANQAQSVASNDLAAFTAWTADPSPLWRHALTWEVVEDTETAFQIEVSECLWARTFREAGAGDIGYAAICHGDFAWAEAYNPRLRLERSKTLMQGHDCCNHRWLWEG